LTRPETNDQAVTLKSGERTIAASIGDIIGGLSSGMVIGGRYQIERLIAVGGYSGVYAAKHTQTGQDVALKIVPNADERKLRRFLREARVTAALKHPNTIRVFDFGEDVGLVYIAMELLKGSTLAEEAAHRLQQGRVFTQLEAIEIGAAITRSLGEAHTLGLVHRDLKPQNIFLQEVPGSEPVLKVLDFGIVKLTPDAELDLGSRTPGELTMVGRVPGTPNYMSPEQATASVVDARADLYALGIILYQLVAGAPPFDAAKSSQAILEHHVSASLPDLRRAAKTPVSERFVHIIERALEKDPDRRFPYASTFRNALLACRSDTAELTPATRLSRKKNGWWIAATLIALAIACLLLAIVHRGSP
jgi:serine/threonine-protein kinase